MVGPRRQAFGQKSTNSMDFVNIYYEWKFLKKCQYLMFFPIKNNRLKPHLLDLQILKQLFF